MQITLTPLAEAGVVVPPPDIVWDGQRGDFAIATRSEDGPVGGFVSRSPIATAVLLLLFTDVRAESWQLRFEHGGDARGWPGDGFDIDTARGEQPLGSRLWLYRRHELTDETAMEAEAEITRALSPLTGQFAVARIDVACTALKAQGILAAEINLFSRDGRKVYAARFDPLWRRQGVV